MKLLAPALQLLRALTKTPEQSDDADLHQADAGQQEPDRRVHALGDRFRAAETDGAGGCRIGDEHDQNE